jgi:hypothetical protein
MFEEVNFGDTVFHASSIHGLTSIEPRRSTHGKSWVYATNEIGVVAAYLGRWSDLDFNQSIDDNNIPVLVERYPGALVKAYKNQSGSIYLLPNEIFSSGKTSFSGEVVSDKSSPVIGEIIIKDAYEFLLDLQRQGKIQIYLYPNRPSFIPKDDSDLIRKVIDSIKRNPNGKNYERFIQLHPKLKDTLDRALENP